MAGKDGFILVTPEFAKYLVADSAATYFLVRTEAHKHLLEDRIKRLKSIVAQEKRRFMEQLRIEDPEAWVKDMRAFLINKHGDIPEVDTLLIFYGNWNSIYQEQTRNVSPILGYTVALYIVDSKTASIYESYAWLELHHQLIPIIGDPRNKQARLRNTERHAQQAYHSINIKWGDD